MSHYVHLYSGNQPQQIAYQSGRGIGEIEIYTGPTWHRPHQQSGAGLGNFFANAFQVLRPLFSSGLNAVKEQGLHSTKAILSQLGKKDLKSILEEEGENALKNLGIKAINKINRASAKINQSGKGIRMPVGLSPLQMQRMINIATTKRSKTKKKSIKSSPAVKKTHTVKSRQIGGHGIVKKRKNQIGAGKKNKSSKKKNKKKGKKKLLNDN